MPKITLLFFASLADRVGDRAQSREVPEGCTAEQLKQALIDERPELSDTLPNCRIAINQTFALEDDLLADGDEVAVIPPVSGG